MAIPTRFEFVDALLVMGRVTHTQTAPKYLLMVLLPCKVRVFMNEFKSEKGNGFELLQMREQIPQRCCFLRRVSSSSSLTSPLLFDRCGSHTGIKANVHVDPGQASVSNRNRGRRDRCRRMRSLTAIRKLQRQE